MFDVHRTMVMAHKILNCLQASDISNSNTAILPIVLHCKRTMLVWVVGLVMTEVQNNIILTACVNCFQVHS